MIPYLDLKAINERHRDEIDAAIKSVLDSGHYLQGNWNRKFGEDFAHFCGAGGAIGTGNGLDALRIMIQAAGLGPGDEIIVPANTFIATILAITQAGCTPVPVEPNPGTFNIDPNRIEAAITSATKAIMAVHLYGRVAPMQAIAAIAKKHNLLVFEDAAQAHGAKLNGRRAGSLSDAAAFSFYPGKNLGCLGDGGAIVSSNKDLLAKAVMLANYGSARKYEHKYKGCNSRLDELQAAVLDLKLKYLDADNERRREIARRFRQEITNPQVRLPENQADEEHVWHIFAVRVPDRENFRKYMESKGIQTLVHYPTPPHRQEAYAEWKDRSFPITEAIHREVVSLPLNPVLTDAEVERIIKAVNDWQR